MVVTDKNGIRYNVTDTSREFIRAMIVAQLRLIVWEK